MKGKHYADAQKAFLDSCGDLSDEERRRAASMFGHTLWAARAKFNDAWDDLVQALKKELIG